MYVEWRETKIQRKDQSRQEIKNVICHVPSLTVHFLLVFFSMEQILSSVSTYHLCLSLFTRLSLLAIGFLS